MSDVLQIDRDIAYYIKHYNSGDQIVMNFNFDLDVGERRLPPDYPDAPPAV